jgi:hypothetical protein
MAAVASRVVVAAEVHRAIDNRIDDQRQLPFDFTLERGDTRGERIAGEPLHFAAAAMEQIG